MTRQAHHLLFATMQLAECCYKLRLEKHSLQKIIVIMSYVFIGGGIVKDTGRRELKQARSKIRKALKYGISSHSKVEVL